ncbi:MAG: hypothetical protein A2X49_10615 [Lentisphaerae bacterium GWF2_52_8]|nr:MAG: hypothetical protein A2X49_10615 [Lentisphaerae bacterium GWF2_52_8]
MSKLKIIVNQLGYRNGHGRKRVLVPDLPESRGIMGDSIFTLMELNEFSKYGLNDPRQVPYEYRASLKREHGDFGAWLAGDFSHITENGIYQAYCGNTPSPIFAIRDDVWLRILPECIRYFQVQSCGRKVPGWHDACHLDDGFIPEQNRYLNAAGGWHDAGDFRKWATSTALNAIALLVGERLWRKREDELGIEPGTLLREAMQGVHYFLGIQDEETGALFQNIGGGREVWHDNLDNRYTDNIPRSGDERRIWTTPWALPAGKFTTLFALYANALRDSDPDLAARCEKAARNSVRFDKSMDKTGANELQWRAWGYLELWRYASAESDRANALSSLESLLALQVRDHIGGQNTTRGFFRAENGSPEFHRKHVGASYPIWVISEFIREWPDHPDAPRWREAIALWVDEYALVFAARNPFGLLPYSLYGSIPKEHEDCRYRQIGDDLYFRYFMAGNCGTNARCSLDAVALAAAADVLKRPALLSSAYMLLEWIIGNNPFQISTMNGVGVIQPCALSFQMGNIPGGVTLGVMGDKADMPHYPHPWAGSDEYYGYQTSHFTWALLSLQSVACKNA